MVINLTKRFSDTSRIYQLLCNAKPKDTNNKQILDFFSTRQHRIKLCIERIEGKLKSYDKNSKARLSKLIFNTKEQLRDFLPVIMDK